MTGFDNSGFRQYTDTDLALSQQRMVGEMRRRKATNAGQARDRRDTAEASVLQKPSAFPEIGKVNLTAKDLSPGPIGLLQYDADFREALADTTSEDSFSDAYVGHANLAYAPQSLTTRDINDESNRYVLGAVFDEWQNGLSKEDRSLLSRLAKDRPDIYRQEVERSVREIAVTQMGYEDPSNPRPFNAAERQNRQLELKANRSYLTTGVDPKIVYGLESIEKGRDLSK